MFEYHEFACSSAGCTWVHTVVPFLDVAIMVRKLYGLYYQVTVYLDGSLTWYGTAL